MLAYGTEADPGIEYITATTPRQLSSLIDKPIDGCLNASNFPSVELLDKTTPLALGDGIDFVGLPCMIVQITTFADNGAAIAVKLAHPLADAQTLLQFTHDWAAVNRGMLKRSPLPVLSPIFDPQSLDRKAAGEIDAPHPDAGLLQVSHTLPLHRYDWWTSSDGCPEPLREAIRLPPGIATEDVGTPRTPLPWADWDIDAPVSHYLVRFSPHEVHAMWEEAVSCSPRVSHLDALLAHIWGSISRARQLNEDEETYLDATFGFRNRLDPPLPPSFLGSPLTLAKVTSTGRHAIDHRLGEIAASIRSTLQAFNSFTLPALLHEMAFEMGAQRLWNGFLGRRNTIVTSWLQLGIRDVDFGAGVPTYVEAVMPSTDGCIQVMEAGEYGSEKHWYDDAVVVSLHLRDDVMQRLLKDPTLRKYRRAGEEVLEAPR